MADRVEQVRLPQPGRAEDHERVHAHWLVRDAPRRFVGDAVLFANDELVERQARIERRRH